MNDQPPAMGWTIKTSSCSRVTLSSRSPVAMSKGWEPVLASYSVSCGHSFAVSCGRLQRGLDPAVILHRFSHLSRTLFLRDGVVLRNLFDSIFMMQSSKDGPFHATSLG